MLPRGGGTSQCGQTVGARARRSIAANTWTASSRSTPRRGASRVQPGRRHGAAQRAAAAAQAVVPGRCLDRRPRDDRRHDRQQQLRRALDPLRQHGPQCARDRRDPRRRHRGALRRGARQFRSRRRRARALSRPGARHARAAPPRGRRDRRAASRSCCAGSAATTST